MTRSLNMATNPNQQGIRHHLAWMIIETSDPASPTPETEQAALTDGAGITTATRIAEIGIRVGLVTYIALAVSTGDVEHYWTMNAAMTLDNLPYRDYVWEFPPLSLIPVLLAPVVQFYVAFKLTFGLSMVAIEYVSLEMMRRDDPQSARRITFLWNLALVPIGFFVYFRLDFPAVVFVTIGLLAMINNRKSWWAIALGFFAKLWPALLIVSLIAYRRFREVAYTIIAIVLGLAAWYFIAPDGFVAFVEFRQGTGLQIESTLGVFLLIMDHPVSFHSGALVVDAGGWSYVEPIGMVIWALLALTVVGIALRRRLQPLYMCAGLLTLLMLASRLLSPQFVIWLLPFAAYAWAKRENVIGIIYLVITLTSGIVYFWYGAFAAGNTALQIVLVARNLCLAVLGVMFIIRAFQVSNTAAAANSMASTSMANKTNGAERMNAPTSNDRSLDTVATDVTVSR